MNIDEHVQTLLRREAYLRERIRTKRTFGWECEHDVRERAALNWAIKQLTWAEPDGA